MINQYIPTVLADSYGQLDSTIPQVPQYQQYNGGMNPFQMAKMLRNQDLSLSLPDGGYSQMNGVGGMGNSIGTGFDFNSLSPMNNVLGMGNSMGTGLNFGTSPIGITGTPSGY